MKGLFIALFLAGCGTQYSDPIGEAGAPASLICSDEPVRQFDGAHFATMMRLVQDDFTIEVWLKTDQSLTGSGPYIGNPIVYADVPAVTTDDFGAGILSNKFQMTIGNPDTSVRSTSDVTTNEWVHVAASRTRATGLVLVFVNGVLEASKTGNTNALSASTTMSIGGRAMRDFFVGQLADLRIWSTVRTQAEILDNMHHRLEGNEAGLVGYYRLDEGQGVTVKDSSSSQNDAMLDAAGASIGSNPPICGQ
jgi:Concanavalin A-like lectin/glucanases superfamily